MGWFPVEACSTLLVREARLGVERGRSRLSSFTSPESAQWSRQKANFGPRFCCKGQSAVPRATQSFGPFASHHDRLVRRIVISLFRCLSRAPKLPALGDTPLLFCWFRGPRILLPGSAANPQAVVRPKRVVENRCLGLGLGHARDTSPRSASLTGPEIYVGLRLLPTPVDPPLRDP